MADTHYKPFAFRTFLGNNDFQSMLNLFLRCQNIDRLDKVYTISSIEQELQQLPNFDIKKQLFFIQSKNNPNITGSISVNWRMDNDNNLIYEFHHWMVDPDKRSEGIDKLLLENAEDWFIHNENNCRHTGEKWMQTRIQSTQTSQIRMLEESGYTIHRRTIKLSRPTNLDLPIVSVPEGLVIRKPEPFEYRKVLMANDEAFHDLWGYSLKTEEQFKSWENSRLFQPEYWKVAWDQDQIAGMVLGYIDKEENAALNTRHGYTEEIAVLQPWRRKGIARWLLIESIRMFQGLGMEKTVLSVDSQNQTGAYSFYIQMGYQPTHEFLYYRKPFPSNLSFT
jgi:mycothiol synthase